MQNAKLLRVEQLVIEQVVFDEDDEVVIVSTRPSKSARTRCGVCEKPCSGYDQGEGRRRGRGLDIGVIRACLEADAPTARCLETSPRIRHNRGLGITNVPRSSTA